MECNMVGPTDDNDGHQVLAALSAYELDHLVAHLTQAARPDDVHRLLTLETAKGRNAWFDAKERAQKLGDYVADVESAILALRSATQATTAQRFVVEYRYALTLASVNALAGQVTPPLLVALVRHGIWTLEDALTAARRTPEAKQRAEALLAFATHVPQSQLAALVDDAMQAVIDYKGDFVSYADRWTLKQMTALVQLASGDDRDRLLANIVEDIVHMLRDPDNSEFTDSLKILAPLLSPKQIASLVHAAVRSFKKKLGLHFGGESTLEILASYATGRTARKIARAANRMNMDLTRAAIAARVAPNLPIRKRAKALRDAEQAAEIWNQGTLTWKQVDIATAVLPTASQAEREDLVRQAIATAQAETEPASHLRSLLRLASQVDGDMRTHLYDALAMAARELGTSDDMEPFAAEELLGNADDLPEPLRAAIVDAVLAAGRRIRVIHDRVHALTVVAEHVNEPRRTEILTEAMSTFADVDGPLKSVSQSFALDRLAPVLSKQLTIEALRVARVIGDGGAISEAVAALAPFRSYPSGVDLVAAARTAAAAVEFHPMKMNVLAAFTQRLTAGEARAAVLAHTLFVLHPGVRDPERSRTATDADECLAIVAPLLAAEDNPLVARAWLRSLRIASRVYDPTWRAREIIGLLVAQPRLRHPERAHHVIIDSLQVRATWRYPYRAKLLVALVSRVPVSARDRLLAELAFADRMERTYRHPDDPAPSALALAIVASYLSDEDRRTLFERPETMLGQDVDTQELRKTVAAVRRSPTKSRAAANYPGTGPADTPISQAEEVTDDDVRAQVEQALTERSVFDRKGLCIQIARLAPMLARLGGTEVADELIRALHDVERWWP